MISDNKILIINPSDLMIDYYSEHGNIIFFDFHCWNIESDGARKTFSLEEYVKYDNVLIEFNIEDIINNFRNNAPLWARWTDKGDQYEQYYRKALFETHIIYSGLKKLNIKAVIFPTSVSHHIDTLTVENACRIANVKQIFPYIMYSSDYNSQYGRLLPFVQTNGVSDRSVVTADVSEYTYDDDLKDMLDYARSRIKDSSLFNRKSTSYYMSACLILFHWMKSNILKSLMKIKIRKNIRLRDIGIFPDYSIITHLKQMKQQRNAISYYQSKKISSEELKKYSNSKNILIAAHFQPEATSFPEGGAMHNHVDIVFELRRKGFTGNILYKEHPGSFLYYDDFIGHTRVGQYRSLKYYKQLEKLGCKFIDSEFELSLVKEESHWYLPVTITGSIALERSQAGLHTIITGYPWYKGLPGTINLSDINSLATINLSWLTYSLAIADEAYEFLKNLLNNKTIFNGMGVGTGKKINDKHLNDIFIKEFDNLVKHLITTNANIVS
jgi:hypothetical protein